MIRVVLFGLLFCCLSFVAQAQLPNGQRYQLIRSSNSPITLDTLSILPNTFQVHLADSILVDTSQYEIDFVKALFRWKGAPNQRLSIRYRVMPLLLSKSYFHKDNAILQELPIDNRSFYRYTAPSQSQTLFNVKGLNKSGSISRGIMFGNNQNLSVNSGMALQMSGKIANDIEILAAISDDNLPIQPEGNTQQLNEFDKVFIQLKRDSSTLIAGDYELKRPDSYFMNFYKRSQGAMVTHRYAINTQWKMSSSVAFAVAKGRSARQQFKGEESNQGPYRLNGNNGENYIVILAGTERVFIDGIALIRGQENDYVIDYNTAEITFTAKQIINQNSRISIEYEYSDKNYSRSLSYFNQQIEGKKWSFKANYYNEKDNRNQPVLQELSENQKQYLAGIGKQIDQAYYANVSEVEYNENEILYEKLTTPNRIEYYRYSTNPLTAKYRLGFSFVGMGKGNYRLNNLAAANGKVYEFIAPIGNLKQGDFEPVTLLITPKQQQLFTFGTDYKFTPNSLFSIETAWSNQNVNLFADKSIVNTPGYGLKSSIMHPFQLNSTGLKLVTEAQYEYIDANFRPIERYRSVEFDRDFNLSQQNSISAEHLLNTQVQLYKNEQQNISYSLQSFRRVGQLQGLMQQLGGVYQFQKYRIQYRGSLLQSDGQMQNGQFYKHWADLNREIGRMVIGLGFDHQNNRSKAHQQDTLTGNSFAYSSYKIYLQTQSKQQNQFKIDYTFRQDELPRATQLIKSSEAHSTQLSVDLSANPNSQFSLTAGYRNTQFFNAFIQNGISENLVGQVDHQWRAFHGLINSNFHYEVGSGQEPRREITYLEVLPGQGTYAWNDYNQNSIKELDEFELARFPDQAKYVPIFTSSTQYIRTNFTEINHSILIQSTTQNETKSTWKKWLGRFSNQLNYKIDRKIMAGQGWMVYNPFYTNIDASNLISLNALVRNTVFFNRQNPRFGIDFNFLADGGKSFMSNGFDTRKRQESSVRIRSSPFRKIYLNFSATQSDKSFQSDLFIQRNYAIQSLELLTELNYQLNPNFRMGVNTLFEKAENAIIYGGQRNYQFNLATHTRYNWVGKGVLNGKLSIVNNTFVGNANNSVAYEMLAGLQIGNNYLITLGLQRNISNGIQLNINYEGRKSPGASTVHTGNMQVRAYF